MATGPRGGGLVVDDRGWPLLLFTLPSVMTEDAVRAFGEAANRAYDRRERFAVVVDTSAVTKAPDAATRRALTDWLGEPGRAAKERAYTIGTAVVLTSGPLRAITAAIQFVRPPSSPQQWTATLPEAIAWARQRLLEAGVPMPPGADALSSRGRASHARPRS